MEAIALIGRIIVGLVVFMFGLNHFMMKEMITSVAESKNAPAPNVTVPLAGIWVAVTGLALVLGIYPTLAAWSLVVWLLVVSFIIHAFWRETDEAEKANQMQTFLKHMAWIGVLLVAIAGGVWGAAIVTL